MSLASLLREFSPKKKQWSSLSDPMARTGPVDLPARMAAMAEFLGLERPPAPPGPKRVSPDPRKEPHGDGIDSR